MRCASLRRGVLVALLYSLLIVAGAAGAERSEDVLATVNDQPITRVEFEQRLVRHFGEVVRDRFIIFEKLVEQEMKEGEVAISEESLNERIAELSGESLRDEGKTIEQQLAERAGDPHLLRHLVRLELALMQMVRAKYHVSPQEEVHKDDVIKWFRSAKLRHPVQIHAKYLPEGMIVRVGEEQVPASHAVELLYLAFPRETLTELLREMALDQLVEQWAKAAGIEVSAREVISRAAPVHEDEPLLERISFGEILKLAQGSESARQDRARRELQMAALVERTIGEDAVQQEFDTHRDWYLGRAVRLSQVFVGFIDPESGRLRSEDERAKSRALLDAVRNELEDGGDFEKLAFTYSEDASALRGGDIGWFPQLGVRGEALNTPALALRKNAFSGPIESPFGYHLIKAVEVRKRSGRSLTDTPVRERVLENLVREMLPQWWQAQAGKVDIQVFAERL